MIKPFDDLIIRKPDLSHFPPHILCPYSQSDYRDLFVGLYEDHFLLRDFGFNRRGGHEEDYDIFYFKNNNVENYYQTWHIGLLGGHMSHPMSALYSKENRDFFEENLQFRFNLAVPYFVKNELNFPYEYKIPLIQHNFLFFNLGIEVGKSLLEMDEKKIKEKKNVPPTLD